VYPSDVLQKPKEYYTIRDTTDKRTLIFKDQDSIDRLDLRERSVRWPEDDEGVPIRDMAIINAYGAAMLRHYASCVEGRLKVGLNTEIRAHDQVTWDGWTWDVESASHDIDNWQTDISMRRVPAGYEIVEADRVAADTPEDAIVRVLRDATGRVDNAVEMTITERIGRSRYKARDSRTGEIRAITCDYVIHGTLPVGASVLVGRASR
jgi:hypothetical protein